MGDILSLKSWRRVEHVFEGQPIAFEVRRLNARQAAPFKVASWRAFGEVANIKAAASAAYDELKALPEIGDPPAEPAADASTEDLIAFSRASQAFTAEVRDRQRQMEQAFGRTRELQASAALLLDEDLVARAFAYVRNVEGVELDGAPVTTGAGLLELADEDLVVAVVAAVRGEAQLSNAEGKDSGSLSTSSPAEPTDVGDSGAKSTVAEGGPAL